MTRDTARTDGSPHIGMQERELCVVLLMLALATGTRKMPGVIDGGLVNPDSYMRMVRLEDALRQHDMAYVVARYAVSR
jgi:hypothetical protein